MATIPEIILEAQQYTGRPDSHSLALIKSSIRRAILACHGAAFFDRDIKTVSLPDYAYSNDGIYTGPVSTNLPKFRTEHELIARYLDGSSFSDFTKVSQENVTDYFGSAVGAVYRILGNQITICYPGQPTSLQVHYFGWPAIDMALETTDSWVAADFHDAISFRAAALVFQSTGEDQDARTYLALYEEAKNELITNYAASQ